MKIWRLKAGCSNNLIRSRHLVSNSLIFDASVLFNFGYRSNRSGQKVIEHLHDEYALFVPYEVKEEVLRDPPNNFDHALFLKKFFKVRSADVPDEYEDEFRTLCKDLHIGEVAVLGLGVALNAKVVLDDKRARRAAKKLLLDLTGTVGLLDEAVNRRWLRGSEALLLVMTINENHGRLPKVNKAKTWQEYINSILP